MNHGRWKKICLEKLPELVPRIAFFRESFSLRITLVIRVDEVEKRAKNVPKSG
jgi:hypothetical protein